MVIIAFKSGRLANRLFAFSHFIANAIEYNYRLLNPTFYEYCKYFSSTRSDDFGGYQIAVKPYLYPLLRVLVPRLIRRCKNSALHHFFEIQYELTPFDLNDKEFLTQTRGKTTITYGWNFRDYKNFGKHSETIRKFFALTSPYHENVDSIIKRCKRETDILIGVHMRRGDYKMWEKGIYYYDDGVYYEKMVQLKGHFRESGKRVSFLLCSNEEINKNNFEGLDITLGLNHPVEDLYSLSRCDYIIGPPSTYSMWASFYGKVPALEIVSRNQAIDVKCFRLACG